MNDFIYFLENFKEKWVLLFLIQIEEINEKKLNGYLIL